jgi:hypothetical protein
MSMSSPFVISFWAGPPNAETTISRYNEIKAAGFTTVCSAGNGDVSRKHTQAVLSTAEVVGLSAIVSDPRITFGYSAKSDALINQAIRDWSRSPALFGYFIEDEPYGFEFAGLERIVRRIRFKDPSRFTFINLFPTYWFPPPADVKANENADPDADYISYVTDYLNVVHPNIVSFDHYPDQQIEGYKTRFTNNLRIIRDLSFQRDKSFWTIIDACTETAPAHLAIAEPLMRWHAMEALRYGTRGILYFLYWTPSIEGYGEGMIDLATGEPTQRYHEVARLNSDIQAVVSQEGEVLFGRVRATTKVPAGEGDLWLINTKDPRTGAEPTTARQLIAQDVPLGDRSQAGAGWDWQTHTMPGYGLVNSLFKENGFWLSARYDLLSRTFYVLNVVDNRGTLYEVTRNSVTEIGIKSWTEVPSGATLLGTYFAVDGFWVAIKDL